MPIDDNAIPSMSDSLNAAIDTVEQTDTPSAPAGDVAPVPTGQPGTVAPANTPAANEAATGERARGPDGKFVRRETDPSAAPAPAVAGQVPPDPAKMATAAPLTVAPDAAPTAWTPAAKEKWAALDPTVKGEIARRERDIAVGMQRAAETRQFGDSVMSEFAPYAEILQQEGATPQAAIRALLETSYTLRYGSPEHKHALFMSLAQQYGIDLNHQIDPEKARLQWELDSRNVNDARQQSWQQDQLQREVVGELEQFIATAGHEHYPTVRTVMAGLIRSGSAQNLQDAYDRACWADPTVRSALQLAENARRAQDQAKNRNAMLSVNGAPGAVNTGGGTDPGNLRGFLEAQFSGSANRV